MSKVFGAFIALHAPPTPDVSCYQRENSHSAYSSRQLYMDLHCVHHLAIKDRWHNSSYRQLSSDSNIHSNIYLINRKDSRL